MKPRTLIWALLVGGTIAGTLDILFAISLAAYNGMGPIRLLQMVASGAFGNAAFSGGAATAALGSIFHFALAYLWTTVFLVVAWRVPALLSRPLVSGIVFGVVVFLAMRLLVLPLSAFPFPVTFKPVGSTLDLLSHMLLFGVPIAISASKTALVRRPDKSFNPIA
ncbi:hypothetical protein BCF11_4111 [Collimonas sp. PA-H2]|uniref:hypothetical protein n=1 Tax=Collimonas sp. PA-H2 TaxID=1881062 RepID=UPI000BF95FC9|nr:hypothetical protein [Collimonas sp. PA-H2]PFH11658.1 hypothetical protein BCF11_4111 [Collimonas sp. PA-H2]